MNTGLEYNLALRVRSATRWVEGQQGMLPDDGDGAVDGFGRAMLVRTGALPSPYTGAEGVAGTTIDQQPTGANVVGVAVLIKDLNSGKLAANTTYSARLGGYLTGKALYFVEAAAAAAATAAAVGHGVIYGTLGSTTRGLIYGDDGIYYAYRIVSGSSGDGWWVDQYGLPCTFVRMNTKIDFHPQAGIMRVASKIFSSKAKMYGGTFVELFDFDLKGAILNKAYAKASDDVGTPLFGVPGGGNALGQLSGFKYGDIFLVTTYFQYGDYGGLGVIIAASKPPTTSGTLGAPLGAPLGG